MVPSLGLIKHPPVCLQYLILHVRHWVGLSRKFFELYIVSARLPPVSCWVFKVASWS